MSWSPSTLLLIAWARKPKEAILGDVGQPGGWHSTEQALAVAREAMDLMRNEICRLRDLVDRYIDPDDPRLLEADRNAVHDVMNAKLAAQHSPAST